MMILVLVRMKDKHFWPVKQKKKFPIMSQSENFRLVNSKQQTNQGSRGLLIGSPWTQVCGLGLLFFLEIYQNFYMGQHVFLIYYSLLGLLF